MITLSQLLKVMLDHKASDMHITCGSPPSFRVYGRISKIKKMKPLTPGETKELCYSVLTDHQKADFEESKELDFSFNLKGIARFRGNIFYQRGSISGAFRHIPYDIPELSSLGLPPVVVNMTHRPKGLVLVTGPAGSGKTTSVAALIEELNKTKHLHILTIEDPIEYVFKHKKSLLNQREVGHDTKNFSRALRAALREDPDIVFVGEMRDKETIETALVLAETGQLVISTLHTNSAYQTISRILNVFDAVTQNQIRTQLSLVLEGIVTQALIPRKDKKGRALAMEILVPNSSIRNQIRENKIHQIPSTMQSGQEASGMITFNQYLMNLVKSDTITPEAALAYSPEVEDLVKELSELERIKKAS